MDSPDVMVSFTAVIAREGIESGDGRIVPVGGIDWGTGPWPLRAPDLDDARVGTVERIWREFGQPDGTRDIMAAGEIEQAALEGRRSIPCGVGLSSTVVLDDYADGGEEGEPAPIRLAGTVGEVSIYHQGRAAWRGCRLDAVIEDEPRHRRRFFLVEAFRAAQLRLGLRRLFGDPDSREPGAPKTPDEMRAEARLWERYGDHDTAALMRLDADQTEREGVT